MPPLCVVEVTNQQTALVANKHRVEACVKLALPGLRSTSKVPLDDSILERQIVRGCLGPGVEPTAYRGTPP
jgi:hypothetical protein